jgi:uncharacterized protein (TIGR02058 family)
MFMFKTFIVEIGMGLDQHGHNNNPTNAAVKAIKNAISNNCLVGLRDIVGLKNPADMAVEVLISTPYPENINEEQVLAAVPFGSKSLKVVEGGMKTMGLPVPALGDTTGEVIVANAAVTVKCNMP